MESFLLVMALALIIYYSVVPPRIKPSPMQQLRTTARLSSTEPPAWHSWGRTDIDHWTAVPALLLVERVGWFRRAAGWIALGVCGVVALVLAIGNRPPGMGPAYIEPGYLAGAIGLVLLGGAALGRYLLRLHTLRDMLVEINQWPIEPGTLLGLRIRILRPLRQATQFKVRIEATEETLVSLGRQHAWQVIPLSLPVLEESFNFPPAAPNLCWEQVLTLPLGSPSTVEQSFYRVRWTLELTRPGSWGAVPERWLLWVGT